MARWQPEDWAMLLIAAAPLGLIFLGIVLALTGQ